MSKETEKYLINNQNTNKDNLNLQILNIYHELKKSFGELPNDLILFNEITDKNFYNWRNLILSYIFKESIEFLKSIYINPNKIFTQLKSQNIKSFLQISDKINIDTKTKSLLYIFLSELCRISDPLLSFNLIIKAFETKIDLGINLGLDHLKNYIYNSKIINDQKKIENCIICGGE